MYFLYFDESGNTGFDPVQRFFTLAALAAQARHCLSIQQRIADLKSKFFPTVQPYEIEIKGRNLIHGKGFFENVRQETRESILHEIYGLLKSEPLQLFATVLDKEDPALQRLRLNISSGISRFRPGTIFRGDPIGRRMRLSTVPRFSTHTRCQGSRGSESTWRAGVGGCSANVAAYLWP
jgi:hypothetical protein